MIKTMKMKNILKTACLVVLLSAGCTKSSEEGANVTTKRYFDAWRAINYPHAVETDGVYVIDDQPGTGDLWNADLPVSFITYTVRSLDGTVSSNTDEDWARQLGTWNKTYYYGQQVAMTGENISYAGVDAILKGMRAGGVRTAIIPSWMMTYDRYDTVDEYLENETDVSAAIYTIRLFGQTDDLVEYEYGQLLDYASQTWGVTDTLTTAAVFFKSFTDFEEEPIEMPTDTTVYINYTGRRISDGQVFDTTIADTAKFYGIYNASKTYEPVSITWAEDPTEISMGTSTSSSGSDLVDGFQYGLAAMHAGEKASFAFGYNLGYGTTGATNKNLVPGYAALRFDIEMVDEP